LQHFDWSGFKGYIGVSKPADSNLSIATNDRIQRPEQSNEKNGQLKWLGAGLEPELSALHARHRWFADADDSGEGTGGNIKLVCRTKDSLGHYSTSFWSQCSGLKSGHDQFLSQEILHQNIF
jgi:hypothetical protein